MKKRKPLSISDKAVLVIYTAVFLFIVIGAGQHIVIASIEGRNVVGQLGQITLLAYVWMLGTKDYPDGH